MNCFPRGRRVAANLILSMWNLSAGAPPLHETTSDEVWESGSRLAAPAALPQVSVDRAAAECDDSLSRDVAGATAARIRAVWINRDGRDRPAGPA